MQSKLLLIYWYYQSTSARDMDNRQIREPRKRRTQVAHHLLRSIRANQFAPGCELPSERELAAQLGVSRGCVREAFQALEVLGVVETSQGRPRRVAQSPVPDLELDPTFLVVGRQDNATDFWEARAQLEDVAIRLACGSLSERAWARVEQTLKDMRYDMSHEDCYAYIDDDRSFHLAIARAAGNPLLERILWPLISQSDRYLLPPVSQAALVKRCNESLTEHGEIAHALRVGDSSSATTALSYHFDRIKDFYGHRPLTARGQLKTVCESEKEVVG